MSRLIWHQFTALSKFAKQWPIRLGLMTTTLLRLNVGLLHLPRANSPIPLQIETSRLRILVDGNPNVSNNALRLTFLYGVSDASLDIGVILVAQWDGLFKRCGDALFHGFDQLQQAKYSVWLTWSLKTISATINPLAFPNLSFLRQK